MLLTEYNEAQAMELFREEGRAEGRVEGRVEGDGRRLPGSAVPGIPDRVTKDEHPALTFGRGICMFGGEGLFIWRRG